MDCTISRTVIDVSFVAPLQQGIKILRILILRKQLKVERNQKWMHRNTKQLLLGITRKIKFMAKGKHNHRV